MRARDVLLALGGVLLLAAFVLVSAVAVCYAEPVDFSPLQTPLSDLAGDVMPTVGSMLAAIGGPFILIIAMVVVSIFIGLLVSLTRRS